MGPLTHLAVICYHFSLLQSALLTGLAFALFDRMKTYHLYTDEWTGVAMGVLTQ